jgi:ribosomal protein S27E
MEKVICVSCGKELFEDDAVFMNKQGYPTMKFGDVYCTECAPDEVPECENCGAVINDWEHDLTPIINKEGEFVKFVCRTCGNDPTMAISFCKI